MIHQKFIIHAQSCSKSSNQYCQWKMKSIYKEPIYCGNLIEQKPIKSSKSLLFLCEIVHISFTHTYFCEFIAGVKLLVEYLRLWDPGLRQGIFIVPRKIIYQILYYSFAISNAGLKPLINPTFVSDPFIYRKGSFAWL